MLIELDSAIESMNNQTFTLEIDGKDIDSITYNWWTGINFPNLIEYLNEGKHVFTIKANANANDSPILIDIKWVSINDGELKTLNVRKLIVKAYPIISASTSIDDLILKITNPVDNNNDFEIYWFEIIGKVAYAAFNDYSINNITGLNTEVSEHQVTLADWDSTELRLTATRDNTVQVTAIYIKIDDKIIRIDYDYTNIGKWSIFKITARDNAPTNWANVNPVTINNN